jgi:oligopeptide/dipeptide ABC transporter ATP-binding protein
MSQGEAGAREPLLAVSELVAGYPTKRRPDAAAKGLAGRRQRRVHAVDGVTFSVDGGEIVALVGESGSGKTSTALAVMRMIDSDSGAIRFRGTELQRMSRREVRPLRAAMQIIYQDPYESLDPRLRVRDAVTEPLIIHRVPGREREARVQDALERAGLTPSDYYLDRYPHELSGGQRQRVAIAAALVLRPELLIADEPVSMLDVSVRAGILEVLATLKAAGVGILMITHDLSTAAHYADRICVMYLGRIVEQGQAREVIANPQHPYTRALVGVVPSRDPDESVPLRPLRGETPDPTNLPGGCRFHPRCPIARPAPCRDSDPALRVTTTAQETHQVACHLA